VFSETIVSLICCFNLLNNSSKTISFELIGLNHDKFELYISFFRFKLLHLKINNLNLTMPTMTMNNVSDNFVISIINNVAINLYNCAYTSKTIIDDKLNIILSVNNNLSFIMKNINITQQNITINNLSDNIIVFQ